MSHDHSTSLVSSVVAGSVGIFAPDDSIAGRLLSGVLVFVATRVLAWVADRVKQAIARKQEKNR